VAEENLVDARYRFGIEVFSPRPVHDFSKSRAGSNQDAFCGLP
jgi:hypothetical protein